MFAGRGAQNLITIGFDAGVASRVRHGCNLGGVTRTLPTGRHIPASLTNAAKALGMHCLPLYVEPPSYKGGWERRHNSNFIAEPRCGLPSYLANETSNLWAIFLINFHKFDM